MKNFFEIFFKHFSNRYIISALGLLILYAFFPSFAFAQDDYIVHDGYACPGMNILKERYQGDCFPCEIVNVLLASFMRAASKVYDVSKDAGNKLLFIGSFLWLAFWSLRKLSSLTNVEPSSMTNELIVFFGKVLVAYCFINAGIGTLVSYAINPILGAGAEFGSALLLETENIDITSAPKPENQYAGPTDIVSKSVMDKILKLSEGVSNEVAANLIIGNGLTCFSIQNGLHIVVPAFIDIHIPDIWLWLCGAAIWCAGFMMVLSVCYYLIDIPFKIGFAIIALPVVIGLWPFKITAGKLKSIIGIALNAAFTFLFLALSASYAIRLISEAFSSEGDLEIDGQVYSGKEALFKAFEIDNVEYVQSLFDFTGPAFLIILFCYIYGIKMISSITNDYPNKFDTGMTSAAGSPVHHMATAATMWASDKISSPFKKVAAIAAHQTGKAATTTAKAAANIGLGGASAALGSVNKFVGKSIQKGSEGWLNRQKGVKAAADSLDKQNQLQNAGFAANVQGKIGKFNAAIGLGLANSINKLGKNLENSGDTLMRPAQNTFGRMASATKSGVQEIKDSGAELVGALTETVAAVTPKIAAKKMQNSDLMKGIGDHLLKTKESMQTQAHQEYRASVQNLNKNAQPVALSTKNAKDKVTYAFSNMKNFALQMRSGELKDKVSSWGNAKIKYVSSGKFMAPITKSVIQGKNKIKDDISRSKNNVHDLGNIKKSVISNLNMAKLDLKESLQSYKSPVKAAVYGVFALRDSSMALVAAGGDVVNAAGSRLNVLYQYSKYATKPIAATVGLPFKGAAKTLGFAAKTVDKSLYAGYKLGEGVVKTGNVLGSGANVLYHGIKDRTVAGQVVTKTLKSGSKTLKLAAKTLKLGRNVILAAAGEDIKGPRKENKAETKAKNQSYRDAKKREKEKLKKQKRKEEKLRQQQERQREENELWKQYQDDLQNKPDYKPSSMPRKNQNLSSDAYKNKHQYNTKNEQKKDERKDTTKPQKPSGDQKN